MADELPLDIGPRYFAVAAQPSPSAPQAPDGGKLQEASAAAAAEQPAAAAAEEGAAAAAPDPAAPEGFELQLPAGLRPGDRLLLTLPAAAAKQHQKQLKKLEKQGGWAAL